MQVLVQPAVYFNGLMVAHQVFYTVYRKVSSDQDTYFKTTNVWMTEVFKLMFSVFMSYVQFDKESPILQQEKEFEGLWDPGAPGYRRHLWQVILGGREMLVPCVTYLISNNLMFQAIGYLDPSVYSVLANLKLLTTALLSFLLLGKRYSMHQVLAIFVFLNGVIQLTYERRALQKVDVQLFSDNLFMGTCLMLVVAVLSGFTAVYLETRYKQTQVYSIYERNLQMAFYSCILGVFPLAQELQMAGLPMSEAFRGCESWNFWFLAVMGAVGGYIIGFAMKHSGALTKTLSAGLALVFVEIIDILFFEMPSNLIMLTASFTILAGFFYYAI